MATAKWIRPSSETIAYFERIAPGPPLQIRKMFGMPCRFLNGHMLVGVYQNSLMLHLSEEDRAACIEAGARPLIATGREMKEYVEIEPGTFDDHTLKLWIVQGMRYLGSLPPNLKLEVGKPASGPRLKATPAPKRRASGSPAAKAQPAPKSKPAARRKAAAPARTSAQRARKAAPAAAAVARPPNPARSSKAARPAQATRKRAAKPKVNARKRPR